MIEDIQREHGLLAAFLEATHKIDWWALDKPAPIRETPKPVNVERLSSFNRSLAPEEEQRDEGQQR